MIPYRGSWLSGGKMQGGTIGSFEFGMYTFDGGLNVKSIPEFIGDNDLTQAYNGYLTVAGGFQMRNGMTTLNNPLSGSGNVQGLARFYQTIKQGVPVSPVTTATLGMNGGVLYNVTTGANLGTIGGGTAEPWTYVRVTDPNNALPVSVAPTLSSVAGTSTGYTGYVVTTLLNAVGETTISPQSSETVDTTHQIEVASPAAEGDATTYNAYAGTVSGGPYYLQNASPVTLGTNFTIPGTLLAVTSPPTTNTATAQTDVIILCTGSGGPYIWDGTTLYTPAGWASAASARWCALVNGIVYFGGIPANPAAVYGTGDGTPEDGSMETLPAFRVFIMSQPVTGLCALGTGASAALVVGMNRGLSVIYGSGVSNYDVQDIPSDDGVVSGRSMVSDQGLFYYLGRNAVYVCDGQSPPIRISDKVEPWVLNDGYVAGYPFTGDRQACFAFLYHNRLHIGYESEGLSYNDTVLVFDLVTKGWTVLQTTPGLNAACLLDAPGDASPAVCVVGSSTTAQAYTWDVEPSAGDPATDAGAAISATFQTKFFKIGVPGTNKALSRVYPEFFIPGPLNGEWFVSTDYGTTYNAQVIVQTVPLGALWDVAEWDVADWVSGNVLQPYVAPASRIDFDGIQGDAFSFGFTTSGASAPWQFGGATAVAQQRGRS